MRIAQLNRRWIAALWATMLFVLISLQAVSADELVVKSEDGDFVGGGSEFNYSDLTGSFTASRNASNGITLDYLGLDATVATVELAGPNLSALAVGSYADAEKYLPAIDVAAPTLRVQPGTGLECSELSGSFEILELVYLPDNSVDSLAVDIEQYCGTSLRKLTAQLRINSTLPTAAVGLIADAGVDQIVSPSAMVLLDGSLSMATDAAPFTFSWQQLSGVPVTLDDPSSATPSFTAPLTTNREYEFLRFQLTIMDAALRESTDEVIVSVSEALVQTTVYRIDARGFLGLNFDNTITDIPANAFAFERLGDNGIKLDLIENVGAGAGEISSLVEMSGPSSAEPGADNYEYAFHNTSKPVALPGLTFAYDSLDSTASLGRFTILEIVYLENGAVDRLAVNFEINDTDPAEIALGYLRYNSIVPLSSRAPIATAGHDRIFLDGEALAQLDGSRTVDQNAATLSFDWTQTAGPAITLADIDTATPSFAPPLGLLLGEGVFAFELSVTNENGFTDTDSVDVLVLGAADPKTYMYFRGSLANGGAPGMGIIEALVKPDENQISLLEVDSGNSAFDNGVSLDAQGVIDYNVVIGAINGSQLAAGSYVGTSNMQSNIEPVLAATSAALNCDSSGAFKLHEIVRNAGSGEIESLAVDFFQNCPVDPSYGAIRINSLVPFDATQPTAIPGPDRIAVLGQTINLDGSFSWDIDGSIDTYQWLQIGGPAIAITGPNLSIASITIPPDLVIAQPLEFELTVTDNDGNTQSESIVINVIPAGTPFTGLLLYGDEGDSGFSQVDEILLEGQALFSILTDSPDQIFVEAGAFVLELMARSGGLLIEDNYENALSIDSAIDLFPGLQLRNLANCVNPSGRFVILELVRDGLSQIQNLAVDFEMDCDDDGDRFYGAIRFNSAVPFRNPIPNAAAGDDLIASEGELIVLDGGNSNDPDSDVALLTNWRQISGPTVVTLTVIDAERSGFVVPAMTAGNSYVFEHAVQDADGNLDTDEVTVEVRQFRTRANVLRKDIDAVTELVDLSENRMTFAIDRLGLVDTIEFTGRDEYQFSLQLNDDPNLSPGYYPIDNRMLADANTIRLLISGPDADYQEAFQCEANDDLDEMDQTGWVEIKEVQYDAGNVVDRISFDFQVFCNENSFWGSVQIDSDLYKRVAVPIADAGNRVFVEIGSDVTLSALQTLIPLGETVTYHWRQLSGEPAVILNADEIVATLQVPDVGASHNPVMRIELLVIGATGFSDREVLELFLFARNDDDDDENNAAQNASSGGSSGATAIPAYLLLLMGLVKLTAWRRKIYRRRSD